MSLESMEMSLRKEFQVALEDFYAETLKNMKLQDELRSTKEFIFTLQERLSSAQAKRKELCDQLQNQDDEEKNALKDLCQKLIQENGVMNNEMQALTMRMSKEIEDQKKNEENLAKSRIDKYDECIRLAHENDILRTKLVQSQNNEQELERMMIVLRSNLDFANEYKDKFKASSAKLDKLLKNQRDNGDTRGLGFEHGESSGTANRDDTSY